MKKAQCPCATIIVDLERQQPTIRMVARAWVPFCRLLACSMHPDQQLTRWREVSPFACTDLENELICRLSQGVAGCRELALLVCEAMAVIFVERERPVAWIEVERQRVERMLVGVAQVRPTGDDRPLADVERHALQGCVCEKMGWPADPFVGPPVVPGACRK